MAQFLYVTVSIKISINFIIIISHTRWALEQYPLMLDRPYASRVRKIQGRPWHGVIAKQIFAFLWIKLNSLLALMLLLVTDMPLERQTSVFFLPMKGTLYIMSALVVVYRERNLCGFSNKNASTAACSAVSSNAERFNFQAYLSGKGLVFEQTSNMIFALS